MVHLGIDLGSSNTLVARLAPSGEPEILEIDKQRMIPSYIYIEPPAGNPTVGKSALDMWADPQYDITRSFHAWKPYVGENRVLGTLDVAGGPKEITPEYLTTLMIEYIVGQLSQGKIGGEHIESVLITVPHGWRRVSHEKCRAMRHAAEQAKVGDRKITVQQLTVSEPVAAAAYWVWEAKKNKDLFNELQNKVLLVCDIGGGTFDLSLVQVHIDNQALMLNVVDAANNNVAGNYVDALLCAWVCQQFNDTHRTNYPTTAQDVIEQLPSMPILRQWYLQVREMKHTLSSRAANSREKHPYPYPVQRPFQDSEHKLLNLSLSMDTFEQRAEPFYTASYNLIRKFLEHNHNHEPYAVLLAGGGSRILGVRKHVLEPALKHFYSLKKKLPPKEVEEKLSSVLDIPVNQQRMDEAIALGAALIANKVVSVQERLLNDIGLVVNISSDLCRKLGLSEHNQRVLIIPLLSKGTPLPATYDSAALGVPTTLSPGRHLELCLVIDDDPEDPWVQYWELSHPGGGMQEVRWEIEVDTDGALTLRLKPENAKSLEVTGRWERIRNGRATLIVGELPDRRGRMFPRVTPAQLREAYEQRRGNG
jgi:molecular chaperone DnaK